MNRLRSRQPQSNWQAFAEHSALIVAFGYDDFIDHFGPCCGDASAAQYFDHVASCRGRKVHRSHARLPGELGEAEAPAHFFTFVCRREIEQWSEPRFHDVRMNDTIERTI